MPRAEFFHAPRRLAEAGDLALDVLLGGAAGIPLPRSRAGTPDGGTLLPPRFVLDVEDDRVRVLEEDGERLVEAWGLGAVEARVDAMDDVEVRLHLRWPDSDREGRVAAEPTAAAREVAEGLARGTRVAAGGNAEADRRLLDLAEATLPGAELDGASPVPVGRPPRDPPHRRRERALRRGQAVRAGRRVRRRAGPGVGAHAVVGPSDPGGGPPRVAPCRGCATSAARPPRSSWGCC